jgi:hypothetical protein
VYGPLGGHWQRAGIISGPIGFVGLKTAREEPRRDFARHPGGWGGAKVVAVVNPGAQVTVSLPSFELRRLALLYDPSAFKASGLYSLSDGEPSVTFRACMPGQPGPFGFSGPTQFNGGFIVAGAQCAVLDVAQPGDLTRTVHVAFGKGECA